MKKVIYDFDNTIGNAFSDVDDGLAFLYLLGCPDKVEVLGVTTTYGNSTIEKVMSATQRMLKELGREEIPLYRGGSKAGDYDSEAAAFLAEMAEKHAGELSLLVTGSTTNLYGAYLRNPKFFEQVREIVLMGGISEPLRFAKQDMDELNFSCDPLASFTLLTKGQNVSTATGNSCLRALFTLEEYKHILYRAGSNVADYIRDRTRIYTGLNEAVFGIEGFYNWDVFAAAYLCHPEQFEDRIGDYRLSEEDLSNGYLRPAAEGDVPNARLNIPQIRDADEFKQHVYDTWLSAEIPYRSRTNFLTRKLIAAFSEVLNRVVGLVWKTGKVTVKFTGKGITGHKA